LKVELHHVHGFFFTSFFQSVVTYDMRGDGLAKNFFNVTKVGSAATISLAKKLIEDDNRSPFYIVSLT
jgi:hypothetical protein